MMVFKKARQLAETWVECVCGEGVELVPGPTIAKPYGWVFFYQSRAYLQNPDNILNALAGNAPFIIDRGTGQIIVLGTALRTEDYLERFEASLPPARMLSEPEQPVWT